MAGVPIMLLLEGNNRLAVDETGNTFAGVLNGRYRVYIDPYATITRGGSAASGASGNQYYVIGYKGTSPYDAGLFYCPYVPLQMVRSVGQDDLHARVQDPLWHGPQPIRKGEAALSDSNPLAAGNLSTNAYYRRVLFANLINPLASHYIKDPSGSFFLCLVIFSFVKKQ